MYLKYLFDTEMLTVHLRMDRGTETGKMATIHVYLLNQHGLMDDPTDSIIYGPSKSKKIERWWRDLHERLEAFFKEQLTVLLRRREYDPLNSIDRQLLVYVLYQLFKESAIYLSSTGIKCSSQQVFQNMFSFPEEYGGKSIMLSKDQLTETQVYTTTFKSRNAITAFRFLKRNFVS